MTALLFICFCVFSNALAYNIGHYLLHNYKEKIYYYKKLLAELNNRYELELDLSDIKKAYEEYDERDEEDGDTLTIKGNGWKLD